MLTFLRSLVLVSSLLVSGAAFADTTTTTCTPDTVTYVTNPVTSCTDHVQTVTNGVNNCSMVNGNAGQAADFSATANCTMGNTNQVVTTCTTTQVTTAQTVKGVCTTTTVVNKDPCAVGGSMAHGITCGWGR